MRFHTLTRIGCLLTFIACCFFALPARADDAAAGDSGIPVSIDDMIVGMRYQPGDRIMSFNADLIDGSPAGVGSLLGKKIIIFGFFLNECDLCMEEFIKLRDVLKKNKLEKDTAFFTVVRVGTDVEKEIAGEMMREYKLDYPVIADPDRLISKWFSVTVAPSFVIIDKSGVLQTKPVPQVHVPIRDQTLEEMLLDIAAGKTISPAQFRPRSKDALYRDLIGTRAPDFELEDIYGKKHSLDATLSEGKPVLLVFWHPTCPPCIQFMPYLKDYLSSIASKYDFNVLSVSFIYSNKQLGEARAYVADNDITFPLLRDNDGRVGAAYHVDEIPAVFILDRSGRVAEVITRIRGGLDELIDPVLEQLQEKAN